MQAAVDNGYDGIEVRGVQGEFDLTKAYPFMPESIDATREDLAAKGLVISCLDTSCSFHDSSTREANLAQGRSHIELAGRLGVPYIRVFGDAVPEGCDKGETMSEIAACLRELGDHASSHGVEVLLETHGAFSLSRDVLGMVMQAEHPNVAVLWDVHHPFRFHGEDLLKSWSNLKGRVRVTHLKDSVASPDGGHRYVLMGEGDVPIRECVRLLAREAPEVWLSLEWEKKWCPEIEEPEIAIPQFITEVREYLR